MNKKIIYALGGVAFLGLGTFLFFKLRKKNSTTTTTTSSTNIPKSGNFTPEVISRINVLKQLIEGDQQKLLTYKKAQSRQNVQNEIDKNLAELNKLLNS